MSKIRIDKSLLSPEDLATYNAIIAKASVPVDEEEPEEEEFIEGEGEQTEEPAEKEVGKSADPVLAKAMERLEKLEKSAEMKEFTDIAKKYAALGENEEELAQTLYDMKKSNEANYNAYISTLDRSLNLVEKSGLFTEIGKSAQGSGASDATGKAEARAQEIMKADPSIDHATAIAKAWIEDPALLAQYDEEYM